MHMHFNVSGPLASGVVNIHMVRGRDDKEFQYHAMALEIPGKPRIWLVNKDGDRLDGKKHLKMFGVRWS